ncbi:hypothetical protein QTG54_000217 [Skeletonema marinoi]|uniref:BHLH domain-containing protein n=1 Tax=Skeletonema marinoi TaxID=267567 RepID=A0AAD8YLN6_9STRA|nr:hypothetical protein QTG54_000217 [Skeletonema marinoi]
MVSSASSNTGSGMTQSTGQDSSSNAEQAMSQNSNSLGSPAHESSKFPGGLQQANKQMSSEERRLERNQREKERSNRIASQVDTLRTLLQRGGLYIPKNTKSTVLTEASNYIRTLQDRQQLMSMEMESLKEQLLKAVTARQGLQAGSAPFQQPQDQSKSGDSSKTDSQDYYLIFNNSMAGMAVASMGGALLDCNAAFRLETGLAIREDSGTTIFNIVHPKDLTRALELISHMVDTGYNGNGTNRPSSPQSSNSCSVDPVFIRSSFPNRPDLGLCITLVRSEDNVAKCFNITLVKNAGSNGEEFNPALPAVPSMVPQISTTSSEASKDQGGDLKAQSSPQSQPVVPNVQVQPQASVPQQVQHQLANPGLINNVVLNNSTVPVPPPAMTPVIPTVNAGVGGAAAVLPPQLMQLIQQLQQQPAQQQQQQIHPQLFNLAQYQQQLQQIPMQNQFNIGNALQGANLTMAGQPTSNVIQNNGNASSQPDQKGNDETVYHFASG